MKRPIRPVAHDPVPTVNLLSPWAFEAIAVRRLQQRFTAATIVLVLLVGAAWTVQRLREGQAQKSLTVAQAKTTRLTEQTKQLTAVRTYVAGVNRQKSTARGAMRNEVYLSRVLEGLEKATPPGAQVETLAVTVSSSNAEEGASDAAPEGDPSACPGPDPFDTRVVVGCVTLSGSAKSRESVGDLVISLGANPIFVEPFISTTTTDAEKVFLFTGSVGLSTRAFSRRYAKIDALLRDTR